MALSVVARDGSSVVLDDGDVRRVLRGRPVASEWDVDSVLGSFESSLDRRAGEWAVGARVMWCCRRRVGTIGWSLL